MRVQTEYKSILELETLKKRRADKPLFAENEEYINPLNQIAQSGFCNGIHGKLCNRHKKMDRLKFIRKSYLRGPSNCAAERHVLLPWL